MGTINISRRTALAAIAAGVTPAFAADYPSRPIRLVVPYAPAGTSDQLGRLIQLGLAEALGQPVIVDNKPGAGGTIGMNFVAKAEPDGYTLALGNAGPNGLISLIRKVPYDLVKDVTPVSLLSVTPFFVAVRNDFPAKDMREFLEYAKRQGDKCVYASVGTGSIIHLTGEHFNQMAGTTMTHSPYSADSEVMTALLTGDAHVTFVAGSAGAAQLQAGKIRYLAVTSKERSAAFPSLQTVAEHVLGFHSESWFAVFGPKGLPEDITTRLNSVIQQYLARQDVKRKFAERDLEPQSSTPKELRDLVLSTLAQWAPVVKRTGVGG